MGRELNVGKNRDGNASTYNAIANSKARIAENEERGEFKNNRKTGLYKREADLHKSFVDAMTEALRNYIKADRTATAIGNECGQELKKEGETGMNEITKSMQGRYNVWTSAVKYPLKQEIKDVPCKKPSV